tara:strand:+ start:5999 stop:6133 length:135 start_codon:yes stop_codon:yes gene_type:complete
MFSGNTIHRPKPQGASTDPSESSIEPVSDSSEEDEDIELGLISF